MKRLLLLLGLFLTTMPGFSQTLSLTPTQFVTSLANLAPHRPIMERDTTGNDVFHGGLINYKHEDNHHSIEHWMDDYPAEVAAYKIAVQSYISANTNVTLSGIQEDTFADLKAQWVMVSHILDIEVYSH